jgi:hypothetical protein
MTGSRVIVRCSSVRRVDWELGENHARIEFLPRRAFLSVPR